LLCTLFSDRKDSSEVTTKRYEDALLLVTQAIDKIMTGDGIEQQDLVISKLLRNGVDNYKSIFPHVAAAIQLSSHGKSLMKGENIQYIYTNSKHKNPLCRVIPLLKYEEDTVTSYDKEKYCDLLLDAAETVLGYFGFVGSTTSSRLSSSASNMKPDARNCSKSGFFLLILNLYLLRRIINDGNPRSQKSSNKNGISFGVTSLTALSILLLVLVLTIMN
jgi:hypothetical protein